MRGLESFDVGHGHQVVGVGGALGAAVDHAGRRHEVLGRDGVHRVVGQVAARNPVDGRVEVRACVFADREIVPVPRHAAFVVAADFLNLEAGTLAEVWREHEGRSIGRQGLRQIDHLDTAIRQKLSKRA